MQAMTLHTGEPIFIVTEEFIKEEDMRMYERLDRLRGEVERLKKKVEDDKNRLKAAEQRLKNAENAQIIADVGALNLSPEQLAQFLQMVQQGETGRVSNVQEQEPDEIEEDDDYLEEKENDYE